MCVWGTWLPAEACSEGSGRSGPPLPARTHRQTADGPLINNVSYLYSNFTATDMKHFLRLSEYFNCMATTTIDLVPLEDFETLEDFVTLKMQ